MSNMKRVNIRVTTKVHDYFRKSSEETGVSMSALMYMALDQYVDSKEICNNLALTNAIKKDSSGEPQ